MLTRSVNPSPSTSKTLHVPSSVRKGNFHFIEQTEGLLEGYNLIKTGLKISDARAPLYNYTWNPVKCLGSLTGSAISKSWPKSPRAPKSKAVAGLMATATSGEWLGLRWLGTPVLTHMGVNLWNF